MQRARENKGGNINILADNLTKNHFLNDTKAQPSNIFVDLYAASKGPCIAKLLRAHGGGGSRLNFG